MIKATCFARYDPNKVTPPCLFKLEDWHDNKQLGGKISLFFCLLSLVKLAIQSYIQQKISIYNSCLVMKNIISNWYEKQLKSKVNNFPYGWNS